ncbi:hypothetical protein HN011_004278 [Eciton burchellii]|nr:hypothetical protein HN011_004278 [Eciton burchellii]
MEERDSKTDKQDVAAKLDGPDAMEQKIITLAQSKPKGISDKDLTVIMPDLQPIQRAHIINNLLSKGYFDLFKQGGSLFYRLKDPKKLAKGADNEEKIIYKIIQESGNEGISAYQIKLQSNLMQTQLGKILKNLEAKDFVKVVTTKTKKKMYMLYDTVPDESLTGGTFYQGSDFEKEFADVLNQQCYQFLKQKTEKANGCEMGPIAARNMTYASSKEVWKYISDLGISTVELTISNIEMILNTLIYDGKIEQIFSGDGNNLYRTIQPLVSSTGLMRTTCGLCPVRIQCSDKGLITPIKCQYIQEWLE